MEPNNFHVKQPSQATQMQVLPIVAFFGENEGYRDLKYMVQNGNLKTVYMYQ